MRMRSKEQPKIVLIAPQVIGFENQVRKATPPFGITCLAAVLEERGYDHILLIDAVLEDFDNVQTLKDNPSFIKFGLSNDDIVGKIGAFNADIIGISSLFSSQTECAISLAKEIKGAFHEIPIVLGGNHISHIWKEIMSEEDSIDFILKGEADYTFAEFIAKYFQDDNYRQVKGLVWREGSEIFENPSPSFNKNLEILPFPAWHLLNMEKYFEIGMPHNPFVKSNRVGSIITSRGCPSNCYYCSVTGYWGHAFRAISSKRIVEMVNFLVDQYKIKELQILDDNFTINYKRVIEFCEGIKKFKLRITFPNAIRSDIPRNREKRKQMFKAMRRAGVAQIGVAPEHGDQDFVNSVLGKGQDLKEVNATCDMAHKENILVHANFMMGFPFETKIERQKTIEYARKLDADSYSVSLAAPLPGTGLWDIVEKNNLFVDSFNVNRMVLSKVNIKPFDISESELYRLVDTLNRELNENAQFKRPETIEKYKLFKDKTAMGDRKYHFRGNDYD